MEGLDRSGSGQGRYAGSFGHVNELSVPTNCEELLD